MTEWQYSNVRPILLDRAELMVWLDVPDLTVMRQVIGRTLARKWHRTVLWNGNVEPPLHRILTDRDHVVRWAWTSRHRAAARVRELGAEQPDLRVVRVRSRSELDDFVARLKATPPAGSAP